MTKPVVDGAAHAAKGAKLNAKEGRAPAEGQQAVDPVTGAALAAPAHGAPQAKVGAVPAVPGKPEPKVDAAKVVVHQDDEVKDEKLQHAKDEDAQPASQGEHLAMVDAASAAAVGMMATETTESGSAQADAGSDGYDDGDNDSTPLIIGGLVVAGGAIAAAAGGGGGGSKTPANSPPTTTAQTAAVNEDAKVTGKLTATDPNNDTLTYSIKTGTTAPAGLTLNSDGSYTFDASNAAYQSLAAGKTQTVTANFTVSDGKGGSADSTLAITVTGVNDAATIGGTKTGAVTEDAATNTATGTLTVTDPDTGEATFQAQAATKGTYGSFALGTDGKWTYTLDNSATATQALAGGATANDTFTVKSADGTSSTVTVTVNGTNDAAVIGGTKTGAVTEDAATNTATGTLTVTDPDTGEATFQAQTATKGTYGSFALGTDGKWTYTLDNSATATNALKAGQTANDTFTVKSADGTSSTVTVTVTGANDAPVAVNDKFTVNEGATVAGNPSVATNDFDPEGDAITYSLVGAAPAGLTFNNNGSFIFNAADPAYDSLAAGATQDVTFTYKATDANGASSQATATVTVTGVNDAAVITGTSTGSVTEDTGVVNGKLIATGDLNVTDVDTGEATFQTQANTAGTYGSFSIDATGAWTFTADNSSAAIQGLNTGQSVTDTFVVKSADGTSTNVVVTINGQNEVTTVSLDSGYPGDDGNPATQDAISAAGGAFLFTDNGAQSNNVRITGFGADDSFSFTKSANAGADPNYSFSNNGTDLVISYNGGGTANDIVVANVLNAGAFVFNEADANTALNTALGTNNIDYFQIA